MRYGLVVSNVGSYAQPAWFIKLASAAQASGWEAVLVWDHLGFVWEAPSADPWVLLSATAARCPGLTLGTAVCPLARYRPHRLASTISTLSHLTEGNLVLGVGLGGVPGEFSVFGESAETQERAARLDEALEVLAALWTGEEVTHHGRFYTVDGVTLAPLPKGRMPVWVGGNSAGAMARAARHEGWIADTTDALEMTMEPAEFEDRLMEIRSHLLPQAPFEAVAMGYSQPTETDTVRAFRDAGATVWLESLHDIRGTPEEALSRVLAGPPRA